MERVEKSTEVLKETINNLQVSSFQTKQETVVQETLNQINNPAWYSLGNKVSLLTLYINGGRSLYRKNLAVEKVIGYNSNRMSTSFRFKCVTNLLFSI